MIGDALGAKPDDGRDMKHPLSHDVVLEGINPWQHEREWRRTSEDPITVGHPSYPAERHAMFVYELVLPNKKIKFAAGEFSNGVYGFYAPK